MPEPIALRLKSLTPESRAALLKRLDRPVSDGAELVANALHQCGVERLSGILGTPADGIFSACQKRMRVLGFRHQMNAVLAAAADNYSSGRLVHTVCVSAGPGIINSLNGIYFARDNHFPLLFLGTRRSLEDEGRGYFQELDAVPVLAPLTKWAATVRKTGDIMPMIREGIAKAIEGQPGPVFLDLPENIIMSEGLLTTLTQPTREIDPVPQAKLSQALSLLRSAKAPLLCLGEDLRWDTDLEALLAFVEREQIPWMTLPMARGILPEDHPLCVNSIRRQLPGKCDCFLLAGGWFDWRLRYGAEIKPETRIIHVHPNEDQLSRNVQADLKIKGQPGVFLNSLATHSSEQETDVPLREPWMELIRTQSDTGRKQQPNALEDSTQEMDPARAYPAIEESLPENAMITVDGNVTLSYAQFSITPKSPFSWLDPGWNGLIGGSIGLAIGLKLANPGRPVIALTSDTSFGMAAIELETCARLGINITVVIGNNGGNTGAHRDRMWFPDDAEPTSTYGLLPYHQVGQSLGTASAELRDVDEVSMAIQDALSSEKPGCLNLILRPDAPHPGFW